MVVLFTHCSMNGLKEIMFVHVPLSLWARVCASLLLAVRAGTGGERLERNNRLFFLLGLQKRKLSL